MRAELLAQEILLTDKIQKCADMWEYLESKDDLDDEQKLLIEEI